MDDQIRCSSWTRVVGGGSLLESPRAPRDFPRPKWTRRAFHVSRIVENNVARKNLCCTRETRARRLPPPRSPPPAHVDDVNISTLHRFSMHRELSTAASQYVFAARVDAGERIVIVFGALVAKFFPRLLFAVRAALGSRLRMCLRLLHRFRGFLRGGDDLVDGGDGAEILLDVLVLHAVLAHDEEAAHDESLADQV